MKEKRFLNLCSEDFPYSYYNLSFILCNLRIFLLDFVVIRITYC